MGDTVGLTFSDGHMPRLTLLASTLCPPVAASQKRPFETLLRAPPRHPLPSVMLQASPAQNPRESDPRSTSSWVSKRPNGWKDWHRKLGSAACDLNHRRKQDCYRRGGGARWRRPRANRLTGCKERRLPPFPKHDRYPCRRLPTSVRDAIDNARAVSLPFLEYQIMLFEEFVGFS